MKTLAPANTSVHRLRVGRGNEAALRHARSFSGLRFATLGNVAKILRWGSTAIKIL